MLSQRILFWGKSFRSAHAPDLDYGSLLVFRIFLPAGLLPSCQVRPLENTSFKWQVATKQKTTKRLNLVHKQGLYLNSAAGLLFQIKIVGISQFYKYVMNVPHSLALELQPTAKHNKQSHFIFIKSVHYIYHRQGCHKVRT